MKVTARAWCDTVSSQCEGKRGNIHDARWGSNAITMMLKLLCSDFQCDCKETGFYSSGRDEAFYPRRDVLLLTEGEGDSVTLRNTLMLLRGEGRVSSEMT